MLKMILVLAGGILFIYGGMIAIQSQQESFTSNGGLTDYWSELYNSEFIMSLVVLCIGSMLLIFGLRK